TTKPLPAVMVSYQKVTEQFFCNPSSIHQFGGKGEHLLYKARTQAADILEVRPYEIVFTSGVTESNNLAIKDIALEHQARGNHLITTAIEHPSVYEAFQALEKQGFEVTYLQVNESGHVSLRYLEEAIQDDTILVSIMLV